MNYSKEELLDLNIIQSLKELGDDFFKEIITLYSDQYPELYTQIINQNSSKDYQQLSKTAHTLKGASLNIGAKALAEICKSIEIDAKSNISENLESYISNLTEVHKITMKEYESL